MTNHTVGPDLVYTFIFCEQVISSGAFLNSSTCVVGRFNCLNYHLMLSQTNELGHTWAVGQHSPNKVNNKSYSAYRTTMTWYCPQLISAALLERTVLLDGCPAGSNRPQRCSCISERRRIAHSESHAWQSCNIQYVTNYSTLRQLAVPWSLMWTDQN